VANPIDPEFAPVSSETLDEFQEMALTTMSHDLDIHYERMILALGIAGEAGEVADTVKKQYGHGHPEDLRKMLLELGDVLFYVAALANAYGFKLSEIAKANHDKLAERYPEGFTTERSINRGGSSVS
jgi:NTP pyrophosphatase (non-canonical NTP hydrolase)